MGKCILTLQNGNSQEPGFAGMKLQMLKLLKLMMSYRYNDTPDEDWVIGHHPRLSNVIVATGGSGHAYKVRAQGVCGTN